MNQEPHIIFLIDQSLSMSRFAKAPVDAINRFYETQAHNGSFTSSLYFFDSKRHTILQDIKVTEHYIPHIKYSDYFPRSTTLLYDSIYLTVTEMLNQPIKKNVIFIILTDGEDSNSYKTKEEIHALVSFVETNYKWRFIYLYSQYESIGGIELGIKESYSFQASDIGINLALSQASNSVDDILSQFENLNI
jgi:hypothetical protein